MILIINPATVSDYTKIVEYLGKNGFEYTVEQPSGEEFDAGQIAVQTNASGLVVYELEKIAEFDNFDH